jgi:DUF4097 and DUF4098 domain-containing protein YvlB
MSHWRYDLHVKLQEHPMTVFMRVFVLVLTACLLQACGMNMYKSAQRSVTATADCKAGAALSIESRNGSVEVIADESADQVQVSATIRCSGQTQEAADARVAKASLDIAYATSGELTIKPVFPDGAQNNDGANIIVRLPSANGATIKTSNGGVTVSKLGGELNIQTSNARVWVLDHNGPAIINTSNGGVEVQRLAGSLRIDTSNAKVEATDVGGPVTIDTSNGPIRLALRPDQTGPLKLDTSNSSITATVGPAFAGDVKFSTSNGRLTVKDAASRIRNQQIAKDNGSISVGEGGGASSVVDTSNGSIDFEIKS